MVSTLYSAIGISTSVSNLEKPKIEECSAIADSLKVNNSPVFDHTHRLSIVDYSSILRANIWLAQIRFLTN